MEQNGDKQKGVGAEQKCGKKPESLLAQEPATVVDKESENERRNRKESAPANEVAGDDFNHSRDDEDGLDPWP